MNTIKRAAAWIQESDSIIIHAGAGMGVDSGLPDFRGPEGFWRAYPAFKHLNLNFEDIANPRWFDVEPKLAWGFYGHRLNSYRNIVPHHGFEILKALIGSKKNGGYIYTTNVDGQFQKAGFDEMNIVEIHGSIHHNQCKSLCVSSVWNNNYVPEIDESTMNVMNKMPVCENCGEICRPNILMFGDYSWNPTRFVEQNDRYGKWISKLNIKNLCVIEIGAGTALPSLRWKTDGFADRGAKCIRIDPRDEQIFDGIGIRSTALKALTDIAEVIRLQVGK